MRASLRAWTARRLTHRKRFLHIAALIFTVIIYGKALSLLDGSRIETSAAWKEIIGEFYPDDSLNAMRLSEREVTPQWDVTMHADDVTKFLNWFQTFCWFKHGMDDHLAFFWHCNIRKVNVKLSTVAAPLDPSMNCSATFIDAHIQSGDDPRCVPWGDKSLHFLDLLMRHDGLNSSLDNLDSMYDEYEVHSSSQMLAPVQETLAKMSQRLDAIEERLNVPRPTPVSVSDCAALESTCPWHRDAVTLPDDFPCDCFDKQGNPFSACRNHHWGLLNLCQPKSIEVVFVILRSQQAKQRNLKHASEWFQVGLLFNRLSDDENGPVGLYRTQLDLQEEVIMQEPLTGSFATDGLLLLVTLASMSWFCMQALGLTCIRMPCNLIALLTLVKEKSSRQELELETRRRGFEQEEFREEFKTLLGHVIVGRATRLTQVSYPEAIMEMLVSILMLAGVCRSMVNGSDSWQNEEESLSGLRRVIWMSYHFLLDDDPCHCTAWLLLYTTIVFSVFASIDQLRWLPNVMILCAIRLTFFLLAYGTLLFGFACFMWLSFGPRYSQFASLGRSSSEFLFLSCGMPMSVFENVHPFHDVHSTQVAFCLAMYLVTFVIIAINFFTTLILDSYIVAKDNSRAAEQIASLGNTLCAGLFYALEACLPDSTWHGQVSEDEHSPLRSDVTTLSGSSEEGESFRALEAYPGHHRD